MTISIMRKIIKDKILELENKEYPRICDTDKIIVLKQVLEEYKNTETATTGQFNDRRNNASANGKWGIGEYGQ